VKPLDNCAHFVACLALAILASTGVAACADRDRLRTIVQQECLPHWLAAKSAAPCVSVHLEANDPSAAGFAVLADRKGGAHYLLIPTRAISGIESPDARSASGPNYFNAAWEARGVLNAAARRELRRTEIGLAVNSVHSRSQDQLHVHIECLGKPLYEALGASAGRIGSQWSGIQVLGWQYQALRVMGTELGAHNPFLLLADSLPGAQQSMGDYTLLVAGMDFSDGPGFVVLAGRAIPGAEKLLDANCAV
jgi:CDP-diacylglycerol pyrophosphatase